MPVPLIHRFGAERERVSQLLKLMTWAAVILAGTYFGLLFWITR